MNSDAQCGADSKMNKANLQYPMSFRKFSSFSPASLYSAPAVLSMVSENVAMSHETSGTCSQGDCLSPSASVFIENHPLPRSISDLQPGNRVLCYDRLSGNLKYAELLDVCAKVGSVEWCAVTLADGTKLEMTADHALQPDASPASPSDQEAPQEGMLIRSRPPVRAADLRPGSDRITVLKVASVPVQSVQRHSGCGDRIALNVQQPERHAIFVKGPYQQDGSVQTMAVESANVKASCYTQIKHRHTFLHVLDSSPDSRHPLNGHIQSKSAPPSIHMGGNSAVSVQANTHINSESFDHNDTLHADAENLVINLSVDDKDTPRAVNSVQEAIAPSESVQALGFRSLGSLLHGRGECTPCTFENRHQFMGTKPCLKGSSCEFCHESHENEMRSQKRKMRRAQKQMENVSHAGDRDFSECGLISSV